MTGTGATDPVLERRARVAAVCRLGQRIGYLLFGLAVVAFFVGFARGFDDVVVTVITVALVLGEAGLAPAIVFSYAVRAADRADVEDDWR